MVSLSVLQVTETGQSHSMRHQKLGGVFNEAPEAGQGLSMRHQKLGVGHSMRHQKLGGAIQ